MLSSLSITQSKTHLNKGGLLAYPTEAVWGLGCNPFDENAVKRLFALKSRDANKGVILLFPSKAALMPFLLKPEEIHVIEDQPKRPTTYIVNVNSDIPAMIKGQHQRLAVRICTQANVQALLQALDYPLVSTSLNPQGMQAARTQFQVVRYFKSALQSGILAIAQGSIGTALRPSRIIDIEHNKVLRDWIERA